MASLMSQPSYTLDELEAIAGWLLDGLSAAKLADAFTLKFRLVSRNGIIGVVHRNKVLKKIGFARYSRAGIPNQPKVPPAPKPVQAPPPASVVRKITHNLPAKKEIPAPKPVTARPAPIPMRVICREVTLLDLKRGECRWPCNSPERGDLYRFCGLPADPDRSYCPTHRVLARAAA